MKPGFQFQTTIDNPSTIYHYLKDATRDGL